MASLTFRLEKGLHMTKQTAWQNPSDTQLKSILTTAKNIAVVGCSPKPDRSSHQIASYLIQHDYQVFPVHPTATTILGQTVYPTLTDIPQPIDIVDVFRKPEFTPEIAKQAAAIHAKTLWLQQGIQHLEAYNIAQKQGMICVMDLCIAVMHRLLLPKATT